MEGYSICIKKDSKIFYVSHIEINSSNREMFYRPTQGAIASYGLKDQHSYLNDKNVHTIDNKSYLDHASFHKDGYLNINLKKRKEKLIRSKQVALLYVNQATAVIDISEDIMKLPTKPNNSNPKLETITFDLENENFNRLLLRIETCSSDAFLKKSFKKIPQEDSEGRFTNIKMLPFSMTIKTEL